MTALSRQQHPNSIGYLAGLLILLTSAVALIFRAWPTAKFQTIAAIKPIPPVQYQPHSVERHGADALAIRKCLEDKKGADEIWRGFDNKTFYLWCRLPDGKWGFMAIVQDAIDRLWYESTSFIKGDGTRQSLLRYMGKFSTRYKGPYPWE